MKLAGNRRKTTPVWLVLFILVISAIGSIYTVAVILQVEQRRVTLFSENLIVDNRFVVTSKRIDKAGSDKLAAGGSHAAAVEMTDPRGVVNNDVRKDDYTYTLYIDEASSNSVPASTAKFSIDLSRDGVLLNTLYIMQDDADLSGVEGVAAVFDLGNAIPRSSMFVVRIAEVGAPGSGVLRTFNMNGNNGVGWIQNTATPGNADGSAYVAVANDRGGSAPSVRIKAGETMMLVGTQFDGAPHDLALCAQATATITNRCTTEMLAGPSPTTNADEATTTLTYVIPSTALAGSYYTYFCQFHAKMTGTVTTVP